VAADATKAFLLQSAVEICGQPFECKLPSLNLHGQMFTCSRAQATVAAGSLLFIAQ